MVLQRNADGTVTLLGEAPQRMRVARELLEQADPAVLTVNELGDIMLVLNDGLLWYRRVGPVDGDDAVIEFERIA